MMLLSEMHTGDLAVLDGDLVELKIGGLTGGAPHDDFLAFAEYSCDCGEFQFLRRFGGQMPDGGQMFQCPNCGRLEHVEALTIDRDDVAI
jgi:hypothetical protein